MANFNLAIPHILEHEGGYVNNKRDPGGATKYGISLRYLQKRGDLLGDFDGDGDVDADDIAAMTRPMAVAVYESGFWLPNRLRDVKSQLLATKIFDMAVNMGSKQAWKLVQRSLTANGQGCVDDGVVGPKTIAALNALEKVDYSVLVTLREKQKFFYAGILATRPELRVFELGWFRRAVF
jgi:lysozyme family protein